MVTLEYLAKHGEPDVIQFLDETPEMNFKFRPCIRYGKGENDIVLVADRDSHDLIYTDVNAAMNRAREAVAKLHAIKE